jgi:hypothetical protein
LELEFFQSEGFVIGYYVVTVAASLALIKETKKRIEQHVNSGVLNIITS